MGLFDYLAMNEFEVIGVQATSRSHHSDHRRKMLKSKLFPKWIGPNRRVELQTWKIGDWPYEGKDKTEELTIEDWHKYQAQMKAEENTLDKTSPLYRELILGEKV